MLRRSLRRLSAPTTKSTSAAPVPSSTATGTGTTTAPMASHVRSSFAYKGSAKGGEVGARNEAAFMNYEETQPQNVTQRFAVPGVVNLLSVTPLYLSAFVGATCGWGIVLWDLYGKKHYEVVRIERPE